MLDCEQQSHKVTRHKIEEKTNPDLQPFCRKERNKQRDIEVINLTHENTQKCSQVTLSALDSVGKKKKSNARVVVHSRRTTLPITSALSATAATPHRGACLCFGYPQPRGYPRCARVASPATRRPPPAAWHSLFLCLAWITSQVWLLRLHWRSAP